MKLTFTTLLSVLSLIKMSNQSAATSTQDAINQAESALTNLVQAVYSKFSDRCQTETTNCSTQIFSECSIFAPELTCYQDVPYPATCPGSVTGAYQNYDYAAGRCEVGYSCDSQQDKEIACSMNDLFSADGGLQHERDSPIAYQYVGFYNSFRTIYPYVHSPFLNGGDSTICENYDPRYRPWYVQTATGAKNVILIIDVSGSMQSYDRLDKTILAAVSVIETLGSSDWFAMVYFSDTAQSSQSSLIRATDINKQSVISQITGLIAKGKTNFEAAIKKAYTLISATDDQEFGSNCGETLILFLTDGNPSAGLGSLTDDQIDALANDDPGLEAAYETAKDELITELQTYSESSARIFTYTIGTDVDDLVPSALACAFGGIYFRIPDASSSAQLKNEMRSYYDFLALGLDQNAIVWSEVYEDSVTKKDFVTAAKAIYFTNDSGVKQLVGVAGVDLNYEEIKQNFQDSYLIADKQAALRNQCSSESFDLNECQLNSLRDENYQCDVGVLNCDDFTYETGYLECNTNITKDPWVTSEGGNSKRYQAKDLSACCPYDGIDGTDPADGFILQVSYILSALIFSIYLYV